MLSLFESWIVTEIQFYNSLQDAAPKINQELVRIVVRKYVSLFQRSEPLGGVFTM
jgi:hypothetical protein